jgi:hypothetical protein
MVSCLLHSIRSFVRSLNLLAWPRHVIEHLLDALPRRFAHDGSAPMNRREDSNLSAAVRAGLAALVRLSSPSSLFLLHLYCISYLVSRILTESQNRTITDAQNIYFMQAGRGGQLIVFQSTPPSPPSPSPPRSFPFSSPSSPSSPSFSNTAPDESTLYGTEDEKKLYLPRDKAWQALAEECAEEGVGVSVFIGNAWFVDVASIGEWNFIVLFPVSFYMTPPYSTPKCGIKPNIYLLYYVTGTLCSTTGGEVYFHPRFDPAHDSVVLRSQLRRLLTRTMVYNCMMRVRCSQGTVQFRQSA